MTTADKSDPTVALAIAAWVLSGGSEEDITSIDRGENGEVYLNFTGKVVISEPRKHVVFKNLQ